MDYPNLSRAPALACSSYRGISPRVCQAARIFVAIIRDTGKRGKALRNKIALTLVTDSDSVQGTPRYVHGEAELAEKRRRVSHAETRIFYAYVKPMAFPGLFPAFVGMSAQMI